jgi:sugar phosphate isomerase/epimerase
MNIGKLSRRKALAHAGRLLSAGVLAESLGPSSLAADPPARDERQFRYCLNTATIRGQKLGIAREIEIAGQAGYDGIEPWVEAIQSYVKNGGTLADLRKRISDAGLTVEDGISFAEWIVDDDERRAKGLERAKNEMDLIAQIGGKRLAAPPAGGGSMTNFDFQTGVERYRALLEAGDQVGVVPQLELWGFSRFLNRLGECVALAMETGHPKACVLPDVFHLYKGGSNYRGIRLLGPETIQMLHLNDFPADPPREKIDDSYRTFPGDGVAPLTDLLRTLSATGGRKVLSLEIFNRKFWTQDPLEVAKMGLAKMKAVVEKAQA